MRSPMSPPNTKPLHKVISSNRFKTQSEETFISQNTIFSSVWVADDISDDKMRWDYFKFCFGFSLSCTMTVLTIFYSPMLTSETIGGSGGGCFYLSFALCSMGGAKFAVNYLGVKKAILWGHAGSSIHVTGFLLMTEFLLDNRRLLCYLNIGANVLGGVSQAIMWAGLGKYTLMMSNLHISSMDTGVIRQMNRRLINHFALVYIINLIVGFMIALILVYIDITLEGALLFFTLPFQLFLLVISSYTLWHIDSLNDTGNKQQSMYLAAKGVRDMLQSLVDMETTSRHKLLLLLPYHVSWGINTAFWILYLVKNVFYDDISFLAASYALFLSHFFSLIYTLGVKSICPQLNGNFHILIGGLSTFCLGIFALSIDGFTYHQAREDYRIVVMFAFLFGVSMSVYENNMRAEVANLLQHYEVIAYSVTSFAKSITAGICLISSTVILQQRDNGGKFGLEVELIISSILGILGFICAVLLDRGEGEEALEEKLLRESERNSITTDTESLYVGSFNNKTALNGQSMSGSRGESGSVSGSIGGSIGGSIRGSMGSYHDSSVLLEGDDERESLASRASSSVTEEFFIPDYF